MSQANPARGRADAEASAWFARLKRPQVSLTDLEAFRSWRADPDNRAAYERIDETWREAGTLGGDAASRQAVNDALRRGAARRSRREQRRAWLAGASAAMAIVLVAAGGAALYITRHPSYATNVGEQRLVRLADGSTVRLDTDTRIDVALSASARQIRLERGQAFFDVAHDPARPFVVTTGPVTVRAVGTKFDVRADGAEPEVTLVEGVVEVSRQGAQPQTWTLRSGEQLVTRAAASPTRVDLAAATSWTSGRVVFENVPLSAAVDEINRYCTHKIILRAPAVAQTPVSGSFETGDAAAFVAAESDLHGLRATRLPDGSIALDAPRSTTD
jgi:transmembrane sensor